MSRTPSAIESEPVKAPDEELASKFTEHVLSKVPHIETDANGRSRITNPTPLLDVTQTLIECAKREYGLDLSGTHTKVLGKFDSKIPGGSIKVRPATEIIAKAIGSGKLRSGQIVFEATSGNFGIALGGMLRDLGIDVITLVSRRLQEGVMDELTRQKVKTIDLDVDICPAPGLQLDQALVTARTVTMSVRQQLAELGLDLSIFDNSRFTIEQLLARQDVIGLAKHLAKIYRGFCPEQYDNPLNVRVHENLTAPEIDQQVREKDDGDSLANYRVVCTFGTGGTSTGISNYVRSRYGRNTVHVVFPLKNQDVAGIRTKEKAIGLRFYEPGNYAGQHEVDFELAKRVLKHFVGKGYDIGESGALALYACIQMINYGAGDKFIVVLADGIGKYKNSLEAVERPVSLEVSPTEARANLGQYQAVLWTHTSFAPKEEGLRLIASSLGYPEDRIMVARARDVQELVATGSLTDGLKRLLPNNGNTLVVCMVGATSLRVAELLGSKGVKATSITGGIIGLPGAAGKSPGDIVQIARE